MRIGAAMRPPPLPPRYCVCSLQRTTILLGGAVVSSKKKLFWLLLAAGNGLHGDERTTGGPALPRKGGAA